MVLCSCEASTGRRYTGDVCCVRLVVYNCVLSSQHAPCHHISRVSWHWYSRPARQRHLNGYGDHWILQREFLLLL